MYPIDLLKVLTLLRCWISCPDKFCLDPNASRQSFPYRSLHRHIKRHGHNIKSRRLSDTMERSVECSCWGRCASRHNSVAEACVNRRLGPAHAVYFATYEAVKHAMGGYSGLKSEHHPLAAGRIHNCNLEASTTDLHQLSAEPRQRSQVMPS